MAVRRLKYLEKKAGTTYRATITVPKGMTVRFYTPEGEQILRRGTHEVAFSYSKRH